MDKLDLKSTTALALVLICLAAFSRLIPHPPNWTAVTAMALFAGSHLRPKSLAFLAPLLAMLVSDFIVGWHSTMVFVYIGILVPVLLGFWLKTRKQKFSSAVGLSLVSSLSFFVISNLGVWFMGELYPRTLAGLMGAFVAALPFLTNTVTGDLFYLGLIFSAYAMLARVLGLRQKTV